MKLEVLEYLPGEKSKNPPLLFVHGGYHGAWCWKEYFLPFFAANGFPSYALSFRGHCGSEGREQLDSFSLNDYRDDVLTVMSRFNEKPVLIGHSMGGAVTQKVMAEHQDKLQAVVLMASFPPNGIFSAFLRMALFNYREANRLYLYDNGRSQDFPAGVFFPTELPVEKKQEYLRWIQPESATARKEFFQRVVPAFERKVPLLVLGSRSDLLFSGRVAQSIAKTYHTEPVLFSGICHDMMLDPGWKNVAERVLDFLRDTLLGQ